MSAVGDLVARAAAALSCCVALACSTAEPAAEWSNDARGGAPTPGPWEASACGQCVLGSCAHAASACASDPACAAQLECLYDCPLADTGDADPACRQACQDAAEPAALETFAAFTKCSEQAPCDACGTAIACPDHPLACQQCPPSTETGCVGCQFDNCCHSIEACSSPFCVGANGCGNACAALQADPLAFYECHVDCLEKWGDKAYTGYLQVVACLTWACPGPCNVDTKCATCQIERCGKPMLDCMSDASCFLILTCSRQCVDESCLYDCRQSHPAGIPKHDAHMGCFQEQCVVACSAP